MVFVVLSVSVFALVLFAVGAGFVMFAVGVMLYGVRERRWVEELARCGVETDARIERIKAHTASGTDFRDGARRWRYRAVVAFRDESGHEWVATTRWPTTVSPRVGDRLRVRYDPRRPKRVVVAEGAGAAAPPLWGYAVLCVIAVIFAWIAVSIGRAVG